LRALDAGQLAEAVLGVTDIEPLPESEPLWSHRSTAVPAAAQPAR
jgi:glyoxylate/hydroxypyruvate reductase A